MTTPAGSAANATKGSADVSAPDSEERRAAMAAAVDDVEEGVRAETYDTDGENTEE
ncbi:MAG: hypothetical protein QOE76_2764 [Frankiales bacterium]|jgi:hypothetical protein|nr:hypothetical protein [Frankiales bacterium]MDX6245041.1 hypothetical protein [Frankiales bacterium]